MIKRVRMPKIGVGERFSKVHSPHREILEGVLGRVCKGVADTNIVGTCSNRIGRPSAFHWE
jgi:hypothetical protein